MTSTEIVTIISAISVALVAIIGAWRTGVKVEALSVSTERGADSADKKLDAIHTLTNSNLTKVTSDLAMANDRIAKLESLLQSLVDTAVPDDEKAAKVQDAVGR